MLANIGNHLLIIGKSGNVCRNRNAR